MESATTHGQQVINVTVKEQVGRTKRDYLL